VEPGEGRVQAPLAPPGEVAGLEGRTGYDPERAAGEGGHDRVGARRAAGARRDPAEREPGAGQAGGARPGDPGAEGRAGAVVRGDRPDPGAADGNGEVED